MNRTVLGIALLAFATAGLAGCGNTLNGAKEDAARNTAAARDAAANTEAAAKQAGQQAAQAGKNVEAASVLTPTIKTAIIRDPVVNDPKNLVDVKVTANTVRLVGHVADASMKRRAEEDAQKVLTDHGSSATISNELTVAGQP